MPSPKQKVTVGNCHCRVNIPFVASKEGSLGLLHTSAQQSSHMGHSNKASKRQLCQRVPVWKDKALDERISRRYPLHGYNLQFMCATAAPTANEA